MKICLLVLAIVILQGVAVNSQSSTIDSIRSMASHAYDLYQQGQLIPTIREYLRSVINGMVSMENMMNLLSSGSSGLGSGRSAAPPSPPQWSWGSGK